MERSWHAMTSETSDPAAGEAMRRAAARAAPVVAGRTTEIGVGARARAAARTMDVAGTAAISAKLSAAAISIAAETTVVALAGRGRTDRHAAGAKGRVARGPVGTVVSTPAATAGSTIAGDTPSGVAAQRPIATGAHPVSAAGTTMVVGLRARTATAPAVTTGVRPDLVAGSAGTRAADPGRSGTIEASVLCAEARGTAVAVIADGLRAAVRGGQDVTIGAGIPIARRAGIGMVAVNVPPGETAMSGSAAPSGPRASASIPAPSARIVRRHRQCRTVWSRRCSTGRCYVT